MAHNWPLPSAWLAHAPRSRLTDSPIPPEFFAQFLTAVLIIEPLYEPLDSLAAWAEHPLIAYPHIELLLVMVVGPMLLNTFFFWIADNLVIARTPITLILSP